MTSQESDRREGGGQGATSRSTRAAGVLAAKLITSRNLPHHPIWGSKPGGRRTLIGRDEGHAQQTSPAHGTYIGGWKCAPLTLLLKIPSSRTWSACFDSWFFQLSLHSTVSTSLLFKFSFSSLFSRLIYSGCVFCKFFIKFHIFKDLI